MRMLFLFLALVTVTGTPVRADEDSENSPNCKLVAQIWRKDGSKKVEVSEVFAATRNDCRAEAKTREVTSWEDSGVEKARVTFGWRAASE